MADVELDFTEYEKDLESVSTFPLDEAFIWSQHLKRVVNLECLESLDCVGIKSHVAGFPRAKDQSIREVGGSKEHLFPIDSHKVSDGATLDKENISNSPPPLHASYESSMVACIGVGSQLRSGASAVHAETQRGKKNSLLEGQKRAQEYGGSGTM
jgi:hypothetical protein